MKFLNIFTLILVICSAAGSGRFKRLINGHYAGDKIFSYQAGIMLHIKGSEYPNMCGGAIINNEWILSAAHCTENVEYVDVHLGANKVSETKIIHKVDRKNIINHPEWNPKNVTNDISLIKIPFTPYSPQIQPITFPANKSYNGKIVVATGWGTTSDTEDILLDELKWGHMKVVSNDKCIKMYPISASEKTICVSTSNGISTCGGDSGGPVVLKESSATLVGVISFVSVRGCSKGYPAVFTRVSSYIDWIKSYTDNQG